MNCCYCPSQATFRLYSLVGKSYSGMLVLRGALKTLSPPLLSFYVPSSRMLIQVSYGCQSVAASRASAVRGYVVVVPFMLSTVNTQET